MSDKFSDPVAHRRERRRAAQRRRAEVAAKPYGEVVHNLAAEFAWPCPADTLAMLVYGGLKQLTEASIRHVDPSLAHGTTCLRHVIDVVRQAPEDSFYDLRKALTLGFDLWLNDPEEPQESSTPLPLATPPSTSTNAPSRILPC